MIEAPGFSQAVPYQEFPETMCTAGKLCMVHSGRREIVVHPQQRNFLKPLPLGRRLSFDNDAKGHSSNDFDGRRGGRL